MGTGTATGKGRPDAAFALALAVTGSREVADAVLATTTGRTGTTSGLAAVFVQAQAWARPGGSLPADLLEPGDASPEVLTQVSSDIVATMSPRERGIFELAVRQGMDGPRLAAVLGQHPGQAAAASHAVLDRAERLVGAVLLCRLGRNDCSQLSTLIDNLGDSPDAVRLESDVAGHEAACTTCADRRRGLVGVSTLLAPAGPRRRGPIPRRRSRHRALPATGRPRRRWVVVAATALAGVAAALVVTGNGGDGDPDPSDDGRALFGATDLLLGLDSDKGSITVTSDAPEALRVSAEVDVSWLSVSPNHFDVPARGTAVVAAAVDRSAAPEGDAVGLVRLTGRGYSSTSEVAVRVERAPVISGLSANPQRLVHAGCPGTTPSEVAGSIVEESGLHTVSLHWRDHAGVEHDAGMTEQGGTYRGTLGPFPQAGDITWWVVATDIRQNRTVSPTALLPVSDC